MTRTRFLSELLIESLMRQAESADTAILTKVSMHIADSLGIALAGRATPMGANVVNATAGPAEPANIIGGGRASSRSAAAFCNAALIHVLDYDDIHDAARIHPTCVTLPAALAASESHPVTGDNLVRAVLVGSELMCRLGVLAAPTGTGKASNWFLTQLFGVFGAAVTAGILAGLTPTDLAEAMGLAYMQASGGKESGFGTGGNSRSIYPAFASSGGVQAAELTTAGVHGPRSALDGDANLFSIYLGQQLTPIDIAYLTRDTGWDFSDTQVKLWPSCRLTHPYIAECLRVRETLLDRELSSATVWVNESANKLCLPLHDRMAPRTLADGKYSVPFMVAFTLTHGVPELTNLTEKSLGDPAVLSLAKRIRIRAELPDCQGSPAARIDLELADGTRITSPQNGLPTVTTDALRHKFESCLAAVPVSASALWHQCLTLRHSTVDDLWASLAPTTGASHP